MFEEQDHNFAFQDKRNIILIKLLLNTVVFTTKRICAFCKKKIIKYHYSEEYLRERIKEWKEVSLLKINEVIEKKVTKNKIYMNKFNGYSLIAKEKIIHCNNITRKL